MNRDGNSPLVKGGQGHSAETGETMSHTDVSGQLLTPETVRELEAYWHIPDIEQFRDMPLSVLHNFLVKAESDIRDLVRTLRAAWAEGKEQGR